MSDDAEEAELDDEDEEDEQDEGGLGLLDATLNGDALARSLVDMQTSNELGLLKSEVRRLRAKVQSLQREKDDMVDNFRSTTQILLNRLKELEARDDSQSRPQTAAVIERIERRPPRPDSRDRISKGHVPEVMRIDEEPSLEEPEQPSADMATQSRPDEGTDGETTLCGNCGREIPSGNLVSHSVYCYRNNYRCVACDEVIAVSDKDSHLQYWTDAARLLDATWKRDRATIQSMAAHGVDFSLAVHPESRDTVLHAAASLGDVELVSFFMGYGVEVDPLNSQGATPLHLASEAAQLPSVKLLVELGADLNVRNGAGETPLMLVCRKGMAQAAKMLLEMKADAEACTKLGDTPLQLAQRLGHQETVLALCSAGAPLRPGTPSRARPGSGSSPSPRLPDASPRSSAASGYPPALPRRGPPAPSPPPRAVPRP
eukprot:TRINITY_DN49015_c0_g1_i1.p1 TRINITY_DN49015_c0_g1~~TRINITY_DN49015_c0_g1_i1.p1  ORF type:complete len:449 (+),score=99.09 TRINITY_DN49015_c0_g1_i1:58-1347(+)